ncbi:uncharacterized protein DSM5745_05978 [Aspergillus mulundensis]|uniref:Uncharacterized protein n=1 Tax=Aspergillus mulundensis TaxID=1810919 RepID=A0A3D8RYM3_9EURO|nr:hypothetical protein DSM5745_05978 [Aspergillus mulundensis]RDW79126.1 hypothetical protein DSM5745_05978 [Aspergillus mulundensis]
MSSHKSNCTSTSVSTPTTQLTTPPAMSRSASSGRATWIFQDASGPLPAIGSCTQGLAETSQGGIVFPEHGTVRYVSPILPRVVLVVPVAIKEIDLDELVAARKAGRTPPEPQDAECDCASGSGFSPLTFDELVYRAERAGFEGAQVNLGDLAEGVWGNGSSFLQYGKGRVVAVLDNVVVCAVERAGGEGVRPHPVPLLQ